MKKLGWIVALLVVVTGLAYAEEGSKTKTLNGAFVWDNGNTTGDLEAVFTPTDDDGVWDVSFHFEFRGRPHVYSGSAKGSLGEGEFKGRVLNDNKRRTFTFEGMFADGEFSGTHAEVSDEESHSTGTLTLR